MSACPTCQTLQEQMPSRVLVAVDGVAYVQNVSRENRVRDLQAACNYLLVLIEQERTKEAQPHG